MGERRDPRDILLDAGVALSSELSLDKVLNRIVEVAAEVTGAGYGALGVIGDDGSLTQFVTTGITARQRKAIGDLPHGRGVLGHLITNPKPIRIPDISKHARSVGFPPHHPPMKSFLGAPVVAMGKVYGNIYLTEKQGAKQFTAEDQRSIVILAAQAGVAIANATLYEGMRQRERWLDALRGITGEILAGADVDTLLARIAEDARRLADADMSTIVGATAIPGQLVVSAATGKGSAGLEGHAVPADRSISGEVIKTGKHLVFEDASEQRNAYPPIIRSARLGPAIFVPLRTRGQATGTLMVANRKGGPKFDEQTVQLVETFADQASVAVEYTRAQADRRRLGLMDERERIAKELHDGIIQSLFAVGMGLQGTAMMTGSPEVSERLERAVGELDRAIRDLRNYIFGLRPGILANRSLDQALRALGQEIGDRSNLKVTVEVDEAAAAALAEHSHDVVQLAREALSNVVRHAEASRAWLRLAGGDGRAVLTVEDDGVGFDPASDSDGHGLRNMRGRAQAVHGDLAISSRNGKGTRLRLTVPT